MIPLRVPTIGECELFGEVIVPFAVESVNRAFGALGTRLYLNSRACNQVLVWSIDLVTVEAVTGWYGAANPSVASLAPLLMSGIALGAAFAAVKLVHRAHSKVKTSRARCARLVERCQLVVDRLERIAATEGGDAIARERIHELERCAERAFLSLRPRATDTED